MQETLVQFLGWEDPLEKGVAIHSSTLAWATPWTEEPGRLQSMGSQKSLTQLSDFTHSLMQPIPSAAYLPDPGIEPGSPALQADSLPTDKDPNGD